MTREWPPVITQALARPNNAHTTSFVYFILDPDRKLVKIGIAQDVQHRITELQTGTASELRFAGCLAGARELEREMHTLFAADRVRGEWFKRSPLLTRLIVEARTAAMRPVTGEGAEYVDALTGSRYEIDPVKVREYAEFMRITVGTARRQIIEMIRQEKNAEAPSLEDAPAAKGSVT